jgi:hypothetical protein
MLAEEQFGQRLLAVAGDTGDGHDLAGAQLQVHAVERQSAIGRLHAGVLQTAHGGAGFTRPARRHLHLPSNHGLGEQ